ncbi:hypothetical protein ElyMa_004535000 [Elysia marginata]|uniref:MULE transposase domain-containing protein n=1 Tax=Elysia marginata TaxID=1093978 RepID=A0AAV4HPN0_9GAST|nr:hypothetical protein ElyMa_004535000 [Elysia marginata]
MATQRPFYDEQYKDFSNFLGEAEYLYEPYCIEFKAASTPGSWSSITHFYPSEDDDGVTAVPLAEALPDLDKVPTTSTSDFQDEDLASPATKFPDDELISPAEAPCDEVDHEDDGQAAGGRSLTDGKFLGVLELIDTLKVSPRGLPSIPVGRKENTLFIIQNQRNIDRRAVGQVCSFTDDCGAWKPSPSPVTRMIKNGERWQSIILRGGQYGTEKRVNGKKMFVPADQQPSEEDILNVHRMYNILKADENYKRRATWLEPAPTPIACVEYIGHYPGAAPQGNAKATRIVLFTTQQVRDIRRFCCSSPPGEGTVLGVDKTFNLGQLHVTPTVFKHLGIVRPTTNTHPIFIGPTLIHGHSDRKTYSTFFPFIKQELEDAPKDLVIGSDEEMAIRIAAKSVFPTGSLISCSRHLKSNMILYLRDKVGVATRTRNNIVSAVFGPGGVTSSPTIAVFEERLNNIQTTINDQNAAYLQHFTSRVLPILQQNLDTMLTRTEASHDWTNNNCESMNHILKMKIDWRPQAIPQLIDFIHEIVKGHYTDIERAIMGRGEYRLHEDFKEYFVQPAVWCTKTDEQRRRHMEKFERVLKIKRSMAWQHLLTEISMS